MMTTEMAAKINEAIEAGLELTCDSHPNNKGLPIERVTTGSTAKIKGWKYVWIYKEDRERMYDLSLSFLAQKVG